MIRSGLSEPSDEVKGRRRTKATRGGEGRMPKREKGSGLLWARDRCVLPVFRFLVRFPEKSLVFSTDPSSAKHLREDSAGFFPQVIVHVAGRFQTHAPPGRRRWLPQCVTVRMIFLISGMFCGVTLNCRKPRPNNNKV